LFVEKVIHEATFAAWYRQRHDGYQNNRNRFLFTLICVFLIYNLII